MEEEPIDRDHLAQLLCSYAVTNDIKIISAHFEAVDPGGGEI